MIMRWNDNSEYSGGNPPKAYHKGDIVPEFIFPANILKMYLANGKVVYSESIKIPKIKLSISVMAHPSREAYFKTLQEKLQISISLFAIDQKNNLIENCKAAWKLYDKTADFHVVIQDDAIVCNNFRERAEKFITDMESERLNNNNLPYLYNFFFKIDCSLAQMAQYEKKGYMIEQRNRGGVAICLPVNQIESMLQTYDTLTDRHDDERINCWLVKNKFKACFSVPSLVDHDDSKPSLAGNPSSDRRAYKFIDNQKYKIPKQIHSFWCGEKPMPWNLMKTWKEKNPNYLHRVWRDKDVLEYDWINKNLINYCYERKLYHGVKDICQYEILHDHGGVFAEADSICLEPIDELFTDEYDSYSCWENEVATPGLIMPLFASAYHSKFAKELIDGLRDKKTIETPWIECGNKYVGEMYKKTACNVKIFPSHYLLPVHHSGLKYQGSDKIYADQKWATTFNLYDKGFNN